MLPYSLCTSLFRRQIFERAGSFVEGMKFGEDLDLMFRLQELGCRLLHVEADTWIYRRHGGNATINEVATEDGLMEALRYRRIRISHRRRRST